MRVLTQEERIRVGGGEWTDESGNAISEPPPPPPNATVTVTNTFNGYSVAYICQGAGVGGSDVCWGYYVWVEGDPSNNSGGEESDDGN